jgi:hypothetical protein
MDKNLVMDEGKKNFTSCSYHQGINVIPITLHRLITTRKQFMYIINFIRSRSKQTETHEHKMRKTNRGI